MTVKNLNDKKYKKNAQSIGLLRAAIKERPQLLQMCEFTQHGETTCYEHCVGVAYLSLSIADKFNVKCDYESLVNGALLHDYFLYDWHVDEDNSHRLHGFRHPKTAYIKASRDFDINRLEKDIILHHMFPLVPVPPKSKESLIVCIADKICAVKEMVSNTPYEKMMEHIGIGKEI